MIETLTLTELDDCDDFVTLTDCDKDDSELRLDFVTDTLLELDDWDDLVSLLLEDFVCDPLALEEDFVTD